MTETMIKEWEEKAKGSVKAAGELIVRLPKMWNFATDPNAIGESEHWFSPDVSKAEWREISVQQPWTTQDFPGSYYGIGWYKINLPMNEIGEGDIKLWFNGLDGMAKVWINGVFVGERLDPPAQTWNKPWAVDVTKALRSNATNEIVVMVRKEELAAGIYKRVELRRESQR